jgi:hypothetical protein
MFSQPISYSSYIFAWFSRTFMWFHHCTANGALSIRFGFHFHFGRISFFSFTLFWKRNDKISRSYFTWCAIFHLTIFYSDWTVTAIRLYSVAFEKSLHCVISRFYFAIADIITYWRLRISGEFIFVIVFDYCRERHNIIFASDCRLTSAWLIINDNSRRVIIAAAPITATEALLVQPISSSTDLHNISPLVP